MMMHGGGHRCWGFMKIVLGALVLMNAFLWPKWLGIDGWIAFFGVLMVLKGIFKLVMPGKPPMDKKKK